MSCPTKPGWWWRKPSRKDVGEDRPIKIYEYNGELCARYDGSINGSPLTLWDSAHWLCEIPSAAEIQSLRARVAELEGALALAAKACVGMAARGGALSAPQPNARGEE